MARKLTTSGASTEYTSRANEPGVPTFVDHTSTTITIALDTNSNSSVVEYAIYDNTSGNYIDTDGSSSVAAVWQTAATWGDVTITGLLILTDYTFKVKARDEDEVETAFSSNSAVMGCLPDLDEGALSENYNIEFTGGNTIVMDTTGYLPVASGNYATDDENSFYGDITITYYLQSHFSLTGNSITVEFSENGSDWYAATQGTGGDGISNLTASASGTSHTFIWDSYTDAGASELDLSVYIRITPTDNESDSDSAVSTDAFGVNNRPAAPTWYLLKGDDETEYTFDKDKTPTFIAVIPSPRGGGPQFPQIVFYDGSDGTTEILNLKSYESYAEWSYEDAPDSWNALSTAGIPEAAADGTNRMKVTVAATDELSADDYIINGRMYEVRDRG